MSDYINLVTKNKIFTSAYHVKKGNIPTPFDTDELRFSTFRINSDYHGKKLIINLVNDNNEIPIFVFMGMSGAVKFVESSDWNSTKYVRLKLDTDDKQSLILYGGYLGPKYSISKNFTSSKTGPDIVKQFDDFTINIEKSIHKKIFDKPIYEVLLDQEYFAGIGNYLRSTILYYADVNPFKSARETINDNKNFFHICREVLIESYNLNGGQLKDWTNPLNNDSTKFDNWVYYQKGFSKKDSHNRTFWYNPKWSK